MKSPATPISLSKSTQLKGLAIVPVVIIHVLAYLPGIYTISKNQLFYIALDQLGRYCVPLFLLLSGYAFSVRYTDAKITWVEFMKSRVLKLIPLYVLWSGVSWVLLNGIPAWSSPGVHPSFWFLLLTGGADYQLYFVVLIFQLYALFPWLLIWMKRFPNAALLIGFAIQFLLFWLYRKFEYPGQNNLDGFEYLYFASWIGYFLLGMWLATHSISQKLVRLLPAITLFAGTLMVWDSYQAIHHQIDPLLALKFTRFSVSFYAIAFVLWLSTGSFSRVNEISKKWIQIVLSLLGKYSFIIFLSHTILLRIIFSLKHELITIPIALLLTLTWSVAVFLSSKLQKS